MDLLNTLLSQYPPDFSAIGSEVYGSHYFAVQLKNGDTGVCATLGIDLTGQSSREMNLSVPSCRIRLIAYYNALLNPGVHPDAELDIFSHIDFSGSGSIVMIGYFHSLVGKFENAGIPLKIFDLVQKSDLLSPYEELNKHISTAQTVIITATTLMNGTFSVLMDQVSADADVYILGPSTLLHPLQFTRPQVKALYGMQFTQGDKQVLEIIGNNGGTPEFSKYARKVCLQRKR